MRKRAQRRASGKRQWRPAAGHIPPFRWEIMGERPTQADPSFTLIGYDGDGYEAVHLHVPAIPGRVWHSSMAAYDAGWDALWNILGSLSGTNEDWAAWERNEHHADVANAKARARARRRPSSARRTAHRAQAKTTHTAEVRRA